MSMISSALITGGVFCQNIEVNQRQTQKSAIDRLQEAVAHCAFHNSGERFDPPKCHPNTRVAVLDKIDKWALRTDPETRDASILWLSGAAGAGKSAISQTLAERFHSKGLLVASFFFGRSDSNRNHARSLVASIVYQLYLLLPPPEQGRILGIIDHDPLIFTKSLNAQFETLIMHPLRPLFENGVWASNNAPRLVIIDGLDECQDRQMQHNVLLMLAASVRQFHSPFIFLLASRPEHDIQTTFSSPEFFPIHTRLFLDETYLPERDIELFLRAQFEECRTTHPFRRMIPPDWPADEIVEKITRKSSGQFIYASVVAKYIKSSRHRPHHRLDVVLNLRPASRDLPFAELDALYTHIFSCVEDIERVLDVISFHIISQMAFIDESEGVISQKASIEDIEHILRLDTGDVAILFCDLASVIGSDEVNFEQRLKILHASLADYLLDSGRSKEYFIDVTKRYAGHVARCFQFLSDVQSRDYLQLYTIFRAMDHFEQKSFSLDLTEPLYNAIRGFSISRLYNLVFGIGQSGLQDGLLHRLDRRFMPRLFTFLRTSVSEKYVELYQHHQSEYDLFLRENVKQYWPKSLPPVFALIAIYRKLPINAFDFASSLFTFPTREPEDRVLATLQHVGEDASAILDYLGYLSDFLHDAKRSQECCPGPKLFAQAAKYFLSYLCDHAGFGQRVPPRMSVLQRRRRKNSPWKWRQRVLRDDIRGPRVTPWLWVRRVTGYDTFSPMPILRRKTNDLIYIHCPKFGILRRKDDDLVVMYQVYSERYYIALICLNNLLPRATKLDDLVRMCQRVTLASRCQAFPRESALARSNMQQYAAQWG